MGRESGGSMGISLRFCHRKVTIVHEGYKVFKLMTQIRKLLTFILEVYV